MLFVKTSVVSFILACAIGFVAGSPIPETNADRLARGLPPAPPVKFRRFLPGKRTGTTGAPPPTVSPGPHEKFEGRIEVRNLDGSVLGNVRNDNAGSIGGVNFLGKDLDLHCDLEKKGQGPFDLEATNALFPPPHFVGADGSFPLGPNLPNIAKLAPVKQSAPGVGPTATPQGITAQSAIWTIDSQSRELTAHYVNPDGSTPATTIAYDIRSNVLFFTGDLNLWNTNNNNTPASAVKFFLVPF
jgi:hypothetical protein